MLDVNCPWTLDQVRERAQELKGFRLEVAGGAAVAAGELRWPRRLRSSCGIQIAAGENVPTPLDFERMMGARAVDFVQPSPPRWAA